MSEVKTVQETIDQLLMDVKIPRVIRVRQNFVRDHIAPCDIPGTVKSGLIGAGLCEKVRPGMSVAVTAGSRGIRNIADITRAAVDTLYELGARPFIVPAMGSHGGATADGQREVLRALGVTEETMGCEIRSSMEVVRIAVSQKGCEVFMDKNAASADGILVINRIKPHTAFRGPFESGLMKMMVIGLGKQKGAETCHNAGFSRIAEMIPDIGRAVIENANVLAAVAIVENPYDETAVIEGIAPEMIERREPELLKKAFSLMPKLMFDHVDALIIEQAGKDISGDGMDPNVTGAFSTPYASGGIDHQNIGVLSLTEKSHGNANGIGYADAVTRRFFDAADWSLGYANCLTSGILSSNRIPVVMKDDISCIRACLKATSGIGESGPSMIKIKDTLHLGEIEISENLIDEAVKNDDIEILSEPYELRFDSEGRLISEL